MNIQLVEVPGHGEHAKTWVVPVTFLSDLAPRQLLVIEAILELKPFKVGFFTIPNSTKRLFIVHFQSETRRDQCAKALKDVWKSTGVQASMEQLVMFNPFHLELFNLRQRPRVEVDITLDEEEEEKLISELLPESEDAELPPVSMADLDKAYEVALAQKREHVLSLRAPTSTASASAASASAPLADGPRIVWCTAPPLQLEVATQRTLMEWQKLEWVLLRCENEEMKTSPVLGHFADFFAIYMDISTMKDRTELLKQAFKTFAEHVKKMTGVVVEKKELQPVTLNAVRRLQHAHIRGKHCQTCSRTLSDELEMDIDGNMIPKHRHGMFCSSECARGRCKGCSFELDEQKQCVKKCGIRPRAVVRRALWREYFEHSAKFEPGATAWCKEKLRTNTEEFLNSTMEGMTYGGFYQITPDAWF